MENQEYSKYAQFLMIKFKDKENFKKIDNQKIKLSYYNLFFDLYQEIVSNKDYFFYLDDINIYLDEITNVFMITSDDKKIIFETPHYSIINTNYPDSDWKLLKLR